MKSLTAIGLLTLLLYHLVGLPLAVLTFENSFQAASPTSRTDQWKLVKLPIALPYTSSWENTDGQDGLVQDGDDFYNIVQQHYANDTLYTLLKTNQTARDRFFDLADQLEQYNDDQAPAKTPLGRLLKLLKDRLTTYLLPGKYHLAQPDSAPALSGAAHAPVFLSVSSPDLACTSPPPEA